MKSRISVAIGMSIAIATLVFEIAYGNQSRLGSQAVASDVLVPLSSAEYNALPPFERYAVANRLLSTLYKGTSVLQFFDVARTLDKPVLQPNAMTVDRIRTTLNTALPDRAPYLAKVDAYNYFVEPSPNINTKYYSTQPFVVPQATLFEFPLSRDYYHRWIAYFLMNTPLFSPALELDSVRSPAAASVFARLVTMLDQGSSIRNIVYAHMTSPPNWERFRSPEDNVREMMEIFLGRFVDADVPVAATACKNWSAVHDANGISTIEKSADANTTPLNVLGKTIVSCEDFYLAVAGHLDLIPTIASTLVRYFFPRATPDSHRSMVDSILATQPQSFQAMFSMVLFSRQYLLTAVRAKTGEETFYGLAHRLNWLPDADFFNRFSNVRFTYTNLVSLFRMAQPPFYHKLGRSPNVPSDTLNFSLHHKLIREQLLLNAWQGATDLDGGWLLSSLVDHSQVASLPEDEFVNLLFLTLVLRPALPLELETLKSIFVTNGISADRKSKAIVVFDYLSRLPELYTVVGSGQGAI